VEFIRVGRVGLELIFEPRDMSEFTESRALWEFIHNFDKVSWKDLASPIDVGWSWAVRPGVIISSYKLLVQIVMNNVNSTGVYFYLEIIAQRAFI
jgi:hypothetical protein